MAKFYVGVVMSFLVLAACGGGDSAAPESASGSTSGASPENNEPPPDGIPETVTTPSAAEDDRVLVVFLGDSLTAGYGLEEEQAHPALIEEKLLAEGVAVRVVNAGVSGDTTAGGVSRLSWLLRQKPDVMVVSLGGNDGLRGLPLSSSEENLRDIVTGARESGASVLLSGMLMPPNYGEYADDFAAMYPRLAEELDVPLVPFLLDGVATREDLMLADGLHPNAEGQTVLAETVLTYLRPLVEAAALPAD